VQWLQLRLPKISRQVPVFQLGFKTTIAAQEKGHVLL